MKTDTMTLAEFKRFLADNIGTTLKRNFFADGQLEQSEKRTLNSANTVGFATQGESSLSDMPYGSASEWEFDIYIGAFSAVWTDPEDSSFQTQYIFQF